MRKFTGSTIRYALLIGLFCSSAAAQSLPSRTVPQGMNSLPTGGSGRVLATRLSGSRSATKMFQALMIGMNGYFDNAPRVLNAFRDPADSQVQASFRTSLGGASVMGLIGVATQGTNARAIVLFDQTRAFAGSVDRLVRVATGGGQTGGGQTGGAGAPANIPMTRTPLPDGSGSIDLAAGWVIKYANQGATDIAGPVPGSGMSLGAVLTVPYTSSDPAQALVMMAQQAARSQGKTIRVTIIDNRPTPWAQGGRAAFLRYRVVTGALSMDYFGLIGITPFEQNSVFFYSSFIQAPTASFARVLPAGLKSWASWSINPAVFARRLQETARTMKETGDLMSGANANRQRAFDGVNAGWSQYVRGVATLEDTERNRSEVDQVFADNVVRDDPNNFRIVPPSELLPR